MYAFRATPLAAELVIPASYPISVACSMGGAALAVPRGRLATA
jgi:hypothetical protein